MPALSGCGNLATATALRTRDVLSALNFSIAAGESVAIVGPSGCGKTTLMKLSCWASRTERGQIEIDGMPLAASAWQTTCSAVASVMQDDQLFAGSGRRKHQLLRPLASTTRKGRGMRPLAAIHEDIVAMSMQYNTPSAIWARFLSGGQKQRIPAPPGRSAKPRIPFLDEATSHLDVAREKAINESVKCPPSPA